MAPACPLCGCGRAADGGAHALLQALQADDVDAALAQGLLHATPCGGCTAACSAVLVEARDTRRFALAARARHRARTLRLQLRKAERNAARAPVPAKSTPQAPALPAAAADALARALARAKDRHG